VPRKDHIPISEYVNLRVAALAFGMRYGADVEVSRLLANLGIAVPGNLVGGLLFVTFARTVQAAAGSTD
jgi:formate/nitrite transporter FocA (FNT family)